MSMAGHLISYNLNEQVLYFMASDSFFLPVPGLSLKG